MGSHRVGHNSSDSAAAEDVGGMQGAMGTALPPAFMATWAIS